MKGLKKLIPFFFFLTLPFFTFAQPVFPTDESNLDGTVNEIFNLYGSQIDLDYFEVYEYVWRFVKGATDAEACPPPYPEIDQVANNSVSFFWSPVSQAQFYTIYHLNLNNGSSGVTQTDVPAITISGLKGLVLFGFHSNCGDGIYGPSNIIIVDVDMAFPPPAGEVPPSALNCICEQADPHFLYSGPDNTIFRDTFPYYGECATAEYKARINGYTTSPGGNTDPYYSELSFVYKRYSTPRKVYLLPHCDENAFSSSNSPLFSGAYGFYDFSFIHSGLVLNIPNSNLTVNSIHLDVCNCRKFDTDEAQEDSDYDGDRGIVVETLSEESFDFAAFPNPGTDYMQLSYELPVSSEAMIAVYDAMGRKVATVLPQSTLSEGLHQSHLDVSSWPPGIYSCQLSTPLNNQVITLAVTKK